MMKKPKPLYAVKRIALAAVTLFALAQCSSEEDPINPSIPSDTVENSAALSDQPTVASLTISGIHTIQLDDVVCSTCTYVVPSNNHLVDGNQLDLRPGSIICLDKAIAYGMLEFVNLEGTEDNPIAIAYFDK
jgi:hypothetical protein